MYVVYTIILRKSSDLTEILLSPRNLEHLTFLDLFVTFPGCCSQLIIRVQEIIKLHMLKSRAKIDHVIMSSRLESSVTLNKYDLNTTWLVAG